MSTLLNSDDLRAGLKVSYEREITASDVLAFARLSGDENPLHVDEDYGRGSNYQGRIVHGAFQVGLASALLGMHLPARNVLLGSINSRFPAPLYYPARTVVSGEVTSWNSEALAGQLRVVIQEADSLNVTADVSLGFTLHERKAFAPQSEAVGNQTARAKEAGEQKKLVVVTGASGALGSAIVGSLAGEFRILALVNRHALPEPIGRRNICVEEIDLASENLEQQLNARLGDERIYGVVHAAWPGAPRGSLLDASTDLIRSQVDFATSITVRLARLLFARAADGGGRFVALGSTAGSFKPFLPLGVYSLAKACLENTIRLLAPELARRQITINAACPSFVPVGINKEADRKKLLQETAATPLGRLCQPEDVVGIVRYLLSPEASFVSGQVLALNGGQM